MLKPIYLLGLLVAIGFTPRLFAQQTIDSELGIAVGISSYHGDLNPGNRLAKSRPTLSLLYRHRLNDYVMVRGAVSFGMLAAADSVSKNTYQQYRNLSFRSNVFEVSGQFDWHFKRFVIGDIKHYLTPYLTSGISVFYFNPKAKLGDEVYKLRDYGTEGQLSDFTGRKKYKLFQPAIILGGGIKYWAFDKYSFFVEAAYRTTFTDYLDDVSKTYVNPALLGDPVTRALSDRSPEVGVEPIGVEGKQRGDSSTRDGYLFITAGITYTIQKKQCPRSK